MSLPPLVAELKAQTGQFLTKMGEAKAELASVESEGNSRGAALKSALQKHFTDAGNSAGGLTGQIGKLVTGLTDMSPAALAAGGAATAAAAGVAALVAAGIGKFESQAAEVRKLKAALGSTAEEASGLRNVAVGLGVDVDALSKGVFKLSTNLVKTDGDFAGVHVQTARNRDGTANLVGTIDNLRSAYQSIQDPQQKNIFLQEALSKGGLQLRAILSATNEEYDRMKARGPIYSDKDLNDARQLGIANRELGQSVSTLETDLARTFIPLLTQLANETSNVVDWVDRNTKSHSVFGQVLTDVGKTLTQGLPGFRSHASANKDTGAAADEAKAKFDDEAAALAEMGVQVDESETATGQLTAEHKKAAAAAEQYKQKIDDMATSIASSFTILGDATVNLHKNETDLALGFDRATTAADSLKTAVDILTGVHITATRAAIDWEQKIDATRTALEENGVTLDIHTKQGQANTSAILDMIQAADSHIDALTREGASSESVTSAYQDHVQALRNVMTQAGFTKGEIEALLGQYNLLADAPNIYKTIETDQVTYVRTVNLGETARSPGGRGVTPEFAIGMEAGPVPGPKGKKVPIFAHAGEWVLTDEQLQALKESPPALDTGAGYLGPAGGSTTVTYNVSVPITTATGDIPDSTIRKLRSQLFALGLDVAAGSVVPT